MKYFLYVGNAYPHKNLAFAIRAIEVVNKTTPVEFYIVSKPNEFTQKLKISPNIKILGFVPEEKLHELYQNAAGFIYPSLTEGFGLPGLEAMKYGTPLLASSIPVFKEIYGNHAIYFDPTNINSLISALKNTLSLNKIEKQKIILANKKFVTRYSWSQMARQTLEVYNNFKGKNENH